MIKGKPLLSLGGVLNGKMNYSEHITNAQTSVDLDSLTQENTIYKVSVLIDGDWYYGLLMFVRQATNVVHYIFTHTGKLFYRTGIYRNGEIDNWTSWESINKDVLDSILDITVSFGTMQNSDPDGDNYIDDCTDNGVLYQGSIAISGVSPSDSNNEPISNQSAMICVGLSSLHSQFLMDSYGNFVYRTYNSTDGYSDWKTIHSTNKMDLVPTINTNMLPSTSTLPIGQIFYYDGVYEGYKGYYIRSSNSRKIDVQYSLKTANGNNTIVIDYETSLSMDFEMPNTYEGAVGDTVIMTTSSVDGDVGGKVWQLESIRTNNGVLVYQWSERKRDIHYEVTLSMIDDIYIAGDYYYYSGNIYRFKGRRGVYNTFSIITKLHNYHSSTEPVSQINDILCPYEVGDLYIKTRSGVTINDIVKMYRCTSVMPIYQTGHYIAHLTWAEIPISSYSKNEVDSLITAERQYVDDAIDNINDTLGDIEALLAEV